MLFRLVESGVEALVMLNLGIRQRYLYLVSFKTMPLYFREENFWSPLDRRLVGSQSHSECCQSCWELNSDTSAVRYVAKSSRHLIHSGS